MQGGRGEEGRGEGVRRGRRWRRAWLPTSSSYAASPQGPQTLAYLQVLEQAVDREEGQRSN
jgi:hypothetical protein